MAIKKWRTISSRQLLDHPRFGVTEDIVELPDGKQAVYVHDGGNKPTSVAILALDSKDRLLVQREYSYPPDVVMWQLPGGSVESNETLAAAVNRELSEESSLIARSVNILGYYYVNNRWSDQRQYVALCADLQSESRPTDPEEFIESHWKSLSSIDKMIATGEITNINFLACLQLLRTYQQQKSIS